MRAFLLAVLLTGLGTGLSGCASRTESYCSAVQQERAALRSLAAKANEPGQDVIDGSLEIFDTLAAKAPDDVNGAWDTLIFAWRGLRDALRDADVEPADYRAIRQAGEELRSSRVLRAGGQIQRHALEVCKVDLGL